MPNTVTLMKPKAEAPSEPLPDLTLQQLNKWLTTPPENSRRVTITPAVATWIVGELNKGNRPKKPEEIRRYAADMKDGRWKLTGDSVKFGTDGLLKDGQNRLAACVQAGASFQTHVVFGIDPEVFAHIDRGKNRNPADVFHIAGIPYASSTAAAMRWYLLLANGQAKSRTTFEPEHLLREYRELDPKALEHCVKVCRKIKSFADQPVGPMAAIYYLCREKNETTADDFFETWADGTPHAVQRKLFKKLQKMANENNGRVHDVVRSALIVQAWNHFVKGQKGAISKLEWNITKPFPDILAE